MFEAKLVIEIPGLEALAAAIAHRAQTMGAAADVLAQRRAEYGVSPAPAPVTPQSRTGLCAWPCPYYGLYSRPCSCAGDTAPRAQLHPRPCSHGARAQLHP